MKCNLLTMSNEVKFSSHIIISEDIFSGLGGGKDHSFLFAHVITICTKELRTKVAMTFGDHQKISQSISAW